MGRSASRLKTTKSGVVTVALSFAIGSLPFLAPVPPLPLFDRQIGILCLGDSRGKHIETADILPTFEPAKFGVHTAWILFCQLLNALDSKSTQVS
jgi:hypothetical protein